MPAAQFSREEVIDRLFTVFRARGFDGASLAELSKATGLGRSSLYNYFPGGKDDMAAAVLRRGQAWFAERMAEAATAPGDPQSRLSRIAEALDVFYAGGRNACVLAQFANGTARPQLQEGLTAAMDAWIGGLARLAEEAGVPAG